MSITTALKARRETLRNREDGFTLIELLVVVIIIGILAAIAIPIYIGVQNNAKDSAVKSDLTNAKSSVVAWSQDNVTGLPTLDSTTLSKYGYTNSGNYSSAGSLAFKSGSTATSWCIQAQQGATNNWFNITTSGAVASGQCA